MNLHLSSVFGSPIDVELSAHDLPAVVGRGDEADIYVTDRWVSRMHCVLDVCEDGLIIRDLESRHGTFVNGEKVSIHKLRCGDQIDIGLTTLIWDWSADTSNSGRLDFSEA